MTIKWTSGYKKPTPAQILQRQYATDLRDIAMIIGKLHQLNHRQRVNYAIIEELDNLKDQIKHNYANDIVIIKSKKEP